MDPKCKFLYVASTHWSYSWDQKEQVQSCFHKQLFQYLNTSLFCLSLVFLKLITTIWVPLTTSCVPSQFWWFFGSFPDCLKVWHPKICSELSSTDSSHTLMACIRKVCWAAHCLAKQSQTSNHDRLGQPISESCLWDPHRSSTNPLPKTTLPTLADQFFN